jgi:UDP-N-acetylglucosamine 2-epimerase (non-hydrolysing)
MSRRAGSPPATVLLAVGARPNLMKAWAVLRALGRVPGIRCRLVHTGQHYDARMSDVFFDDLALPAPDVHLGVGSGTQTTQTARIMLAFEPVLAAEHADLVVVVGDVNSTVACALVAAKAGVPVAHVEAGLRSGDWTMPEEINRVVTDRLADHLFAPSADAVRNLRREGVARRRIHLVGNVMIDTLRAHRARAERSDVRRRLGVARSPYALLTLHRPANVDVPEALSGLLAAVEWVQGRLPVVFPVHPRTHAQLAQPTLAPRLAAMPGLRLTEPLGYLDFLHLMAHARLVLTDSGGVQEETTALGVPCLTLRDTTERPATVSQGTNRVVGTRPEGIVRAARRVLAGPRPRRRVPPLWDGHAGERVARVLARVVAGRG